MSRARSEGANGVEDARAKLEAELKKMMAENRDLFRAVVKYVEVRDECNKARGQGQIVYTDGSAQVPDGPGPVPVQ
jgi:flavin reductase (DIM6/NTAB) family NADH-FMN oxidoreductase RutF